MATEGAIQHKRSISATSLLLPDDHNVAVTANDSPMNEGPESPPSSTTEPVRRKLKRRLVSVEPNFIARLVNAKWDAKERRCEVERKLELLELRKLSSDQNVHIFNF